MTVPHRVVVAAAVVDRAEGYPIGRKFLLVVEGYFILLI
jgi:hypothetical protein